MKASSERTRRWNLGWGLTSRCNMNCGFCYSRQVRLDCDGPTYETWKQFLVRNAGFIQSINWGTGESTLSQDWLRLISQIVEEPYPFKMSLTTNGYLSQIAKDPAIADLVCTGIAEVDVSLDYGDKERHNAIRHSVEAFDWALETLEFCQRKGILSTVVMVGIPDTLARENLSSLIRIAREYSSLLRLNLYRPVGSTCPYEMRAFVERAWEAVAYLTLNCRPIAFSDPLFAAVALGQRVEDPVGGPSCRILPNGHMTPATYLTTPDWSAAHVADANLSNLQESTPFLLLQTTDLPSVCTDCSHKLLCLGGCKDRRILYRGQLSERDPFCPYSVVTDFESPIDGTSRPVAETSLIHANYLPTLIFEPNNDRRENR